MGAMKEKWCLPVHVAPIISFMPPSSLDPGENSALVDAQNHLHTLLRAHACAAGPWLGAPTLSASCFGHARVPPDLRACLPVHRYPPQTLHVVPPATVVRTEQLPLMVIIFALRFFRDDPTTTPTRHDSLDLQPVYRPLAQPRDINGVSPFRQRPMYCPFSTGGTPVIIQVNFFATSVPNSIIHHARTLPACMTMDFIRRLHLDVAPQIFTPRCVYDGRKKHLLCIHRLKFDTGSQEFDVTLADEAPQGLQDQVDSRRLHRFIESKGSHDNTVLTAITALNVIRMQPKLLYYPFNVRPFFTDRETKDIGPDIDLCKLIFDAGSFSLFVQALAKCSANVDISTGTMYKMGPLLRLCLEFMGKNQPKELLPTHGLPDREQLCLQRFICSSRILTTHCDPDGQKRTTPRVQETEHCARQQAHVHHAREGQSMTVANYFQYTQNKSLQFLPNVICAGLDPAPSFRWVSSDVIFCHLFVISAPLEKTKDVLDLAIKKPLDRLQGIKNGLGVIKGPRLRAIRIRPPIVVILPEGDNNIYTTSPPSLASVLIDPHDWTIAIRYSPRAAFKSSPTWARKRAHPLTVFLRATVAHLTGLGSAEVAVLLERWMWY
ncbi:hypothetical protein B0H14DRAFT_3584904 [Mycena olivaceomarginata]|nr:hypothetical protein B0H14DRAFT_3584904 [Mycena olivaceomarginata]